MITSVFKKFTVTLSAVCLMIGAVLAHEHFNPNIDYGTLTDTRDGKTYRTVVIGEQTWMAENLNFETESGSLCYNNSTDSCSKYGRLYDWNTAMNGAASSDGVPSGVQGVCPTGWHLPSDAEWADLMTSVGGRDVAGRKLRSLDGWRYCGPPGSGENYVCEDAYGFSAIPSGFYYVNNYNVGSFSDIFWYGLWFSATEFIDTSYAWSQSMGYDRELVIAYFGNKTHGLSVRCIKNADGSSVNPTNRASNIKTSLAHVTVRNRTLIVKPFASSSQTPVSQIRLIDMRGKSVASFTASQCSGGSTCPPIAFSLAKIPAGRYFVEIHDGVKRERVSVGVGVR